MGHIIKWQQTKRTIEFVSLVSSLPLIIVIIIIAVVVAVCGWLVGWMSGVEWGTSNIINECLSFGVECGDNSYT